MSLESGLTMDTPDGYPLDLAERAWLDDGTTLEFRPVRPDDAERFQRLFARLSPESLYQRFFTPVTRLQPSMLHRLLHVDYHDLLALLAVVEDEVVGVARYDRLPGSREAEAALIIEDAWQGRGLGTRLLWRLSAAARERGIEAFVGSVLGENRRMMGLLRTLSDDVEAHLEGGVYQFRLQLAPPPAAG
jgi:predicted N-acetyltransferase YhbS